MSYKIAYIQYRNGTNVLPFRFHVQLAAKLCFRCCLVQVLVAMVWKWNQNAASLEVNIETDSGALCRITPLRLIVQLF